MHEPKQAQTELDWNAAPPPPSTAATVIGAGDAASARPAPAPPLTGRIAFASPEEQVQRTAELLGEGAVVVTIPPLPAMMRGHLAEHLEEHLERELAVRGVPSPYLAAWSAMPDDAEERLADQLFRARTTGATGIALAMGSIAAAACPALTPEDSATLRWLARATTHAPLVVMLDDADTFASGYDAPVALGTLLGRTGRLPDVAMADARVAAMVDRVVVDPEDEPIASDVPDVSEIVAGALGDTDVASDPMVFDGTKLPEVDAAEASAAALVAAPDGESLGTDVADDAQTANETAVADVDEQTATAAVTGNQIDAVETVETVDVVAVTTVSVATLEPLEKPARGRGTGGDRGRARATVGIPVAGPSDYWRSWALALGAVRGPLPLAAFERLFAESYVPLANAIAGGLDDPRAVRAYDEFRRTFERAYTDAFATFGATNRRPRLVMDAYDVASKQARLHNARTAHVLVIDSLRWDLGALVRDALTAKASGTASLTSETVLWSALPTTTIRQLETIARGMDALRAPATEEPQESLRGRSAEVVRRLRVGSRELYKLDLVPTMLAGLGDEPGAEVVVGALDEVASAVADAIVRHIETLPPRTLLLIAGDHGFTVDRRGRILHGGASPEEVLVPAYAFLVGELH